MKRYILLVAGSILFLIMGLTAPVPSYAAEGNVGYDVQAVIPENQLDKSKSYFDLRMEPGQEQTINIQINNTSNEDTDFQVNVNQAYTNDQGFIDYADEKEVQKNDYPLKLAAIASVAPKVNVKKNSSLQVPITLKMPDATFDGQILGAVQVLKSAAGDSAGISNSYGYILGLKLTETDNQVKRALQLKEVRPAASFGKASVVAVLENPTMDAFGHLTYDALVTKSDSNEKVRKVSYDSNMQIAPNSVYNFAIDWKDQALEPGAYKLHLEVKDAKKNVWIFDKKFSISGKEADAINAVTVDAAKQQRLPLWMYVAMGILLAIILLIGIWLILVKRRSKVSEGAEN